MFMDEAITLGYQALTRGEFPVGGVIVHKGKVIARAQNEVEAARNPTHHAELLAINKALAYMGDKYLSECDIFVTLEPCLMCFKALSLVKIRRIYFGAYSTDGNYSIEKLKAKSLDLNHIPEIYGGFGADLIAPLFKQHLEIMRSTLK